MAPNGLIDDQRIINIKISIIGEGYVGKTSFRKQFLGQGFSIEYLATLGADFAIKTLEHNGITWRLQIWDIAGQPRFNQIRKNFFTGSQIAFVMYAVNDKQSLNQVMDWVNEIWENNGKGKVPILLLGNKIDLRESVEDCLTLDDCKKIRNEIESFVDFKVPFFETSAKTGENVNDAFQKIISEFVSFYKVNLS
ncbi:MAG: GTPase KRas precursor [Candidatus Heimdallarchaeota archaeon LC_3]|nr:MAG: GTPase KRas precursor [Candidatus Heimdallarchaeota archaeon LC_3]